MPGQPSVSRWLAWGAATGAAGSAALVGPDTRLDRPSELSEFVLFILVGAFASTWSVAAIFSFRHGRGWARELDWRRGLWRLWAALSLPWAGLFTVPVIIEATARAIKGTGYTTQVEVALQLAIGVPAFFAAPLYAMAAWAWIGEGFRKRPAPLPSGP